MKRTNRPHNGFTLIEVLVAMLVSSAGILGLIALQAQTLKATQDTNNYSHGIWVFNDIVNRIKINRGNPSLYLTNAFACGQVAPACSAYNNGNSIEAAIDCTPTEVAQFDLWSLMCGTTAADQRANSFSSSVDFLVAPTIQIQCLNATCNTLSAPVRITLSWNSRVDDSQRLTISEVIKP